MENKRLVAFVDAMFLIVSYGLVPLAYFYAGAESTFFFASIANAAFITVFGVSVNLMLADMERRHLKMMNTLRELTNT